MPAPPPDDAIGRSLAMVAIGTAFFERTQPFQSRSEIRLSDGLAHAGGLSFNATGVTTTVRNHALENVVLDGDSLILFKDGYAIPETAYFDSPDAARYLPADTELIDVSENEVVIIGYNNPHWGYQHWVTQCLPAIDWSLRQKRTREVRLLLPHMAVWQAEFLVLLGYDRIPSLTPLAAAKYRLPRAEYSDYLNGTTSFDVCLSTLDTARRIAHAVPTFRSEDKILYIDDVSPHYGGVRNEGALIDLLRKRGVTIVERGRLSAAQRINLFRNADVVIGPLGQGLTDVLFCRPGTLLWEWMPRHHQNVSFNRLAQAAEVDYWGEMFESLAEPDKPGQWEVDLGLVARRLSELTVRLSPSAVIETTSVAPSALAISSPGRRPIDELLLSFESLGDNCEFGLVQRQAGAEPLGLFRFNGFYVPPEFRLERLVAGLERRFDGLGAAGTLTVSAEGVAGQRELIVRDSIYDFWYHTGIEEGKIDPAEQSALETIRLGFLRRKLLEDLASGDKVWVWKSQGSNNRDQIQPLLDMLRRLGPNTLLWVVEADDTHPAGLVETLEHDLLIGYVERFAPYEAIANIHFGSWFEVCWRADETLRANKAAADPEAPSNVEPQYQAPPRPLTAMDYLAHNPSVPSPAAAVAPERKRVVRPWRWLRRG